MHSEFATHIRKAVSKKKKRYQKQGFNLDLSYVTDKIIAMGFPADNFEAFYRNHIDDVVRFFDVNHNGCYKIYNLCREREFDVSKFTGETARYPFDDHNPPEFKILISCIEDIAEFLGRDSDNVVAINCKAGKGRTGVVVCCCLLRLAVSRDAGSALTDYGRSRTLNGKGVTIPSQVRYIRYYDALINRHGPLSVSVPALRYEPLPLWLQMVTLDVAPLLGVCDLEFCIYKIDSNARLYRSGVHRVTKTSRTVVFLEMMNFPLYGDLKFQFLYKSALTGTKSLCQCWLNTFFVVHKPAHLQLAASAMAVAIGGDSASLSMCDTGDYDSGGTRYRHQPVGVTNTAAAVTGARTNQYQQLRPPPYGKLRHSRSYQDMLADNQGDCDEESPQFSFSSGGSVGAITAADDLESSSQGHNYKVTLSKSEIDGAHKDATCRIFPHNFSITFVFSNSAPDVSPTPSTNQSLGNSHFFEPPAYMTGGINNSAVETASPPEEDLIPQMEKAWSASSKFYLNN